LFAYLSVASGIHCVGFWVYQLGFLFQEPKYRCVLRDGADTSVCTSANICAGDGRILDWSVDWAHDNSLHNWHEQFDLQCWPKAQIGFMSSLYFLGWCFAVLWTPRLGDVYGRKWVVTFNNLACLFIYLGVLFAPNVNFLAAVIFIDGLFMPVRTGVSFMYLMELVPADW